MTRQELKDAIHAKGVEFKSGLTKADLQEIYDRLLIKQPKVPVIEPVVPQKAPDTEPVAEPDPVPDVEPEPVTPGETVPGDEPAPVTTPEPIPAPTGIGEVAFDELLGKIGSAEVPKDKTKKEKPLFEVSRQKTRKGKSSPDSMRIEGYVLMLVIDTVFPAGLAFINNAIDKRIKIQAHQLSLNEHDFAKLEALADQAADYLAINLNPVAGFLLVAAFFYSSNLINVRMGVSVSDVTKE